MKKITLGVFVFSVIALLGVGIVAAFPFGFGKGQMAQNLTEEEQTEMQAFHDSLQTAIENEDFDSWKILMESQLTEENFNNVIERNQEMEQRRTEMEEQRTEFCEDHDCPELGDEDFLDFKGPHGMRGNPEMGECPFASSDSE